jgi:hypothetical protein
VPEPILSVVVVIVSDTTDRRIDVQYLRRSLESLRHQEDAPPMEIIVPHLPAVAVEALKREFPEARFLEIRDLKTYTGESGGREHHDELRARGLTAARGEIVGLLEDHGVAAPGWARAAVELHRQHADFAAIGGAIENAVDRPLNHAVYFCDFLRYKSPLPEGSSGFASDANITYKRADLEQIRGVWQQIFHETAVNGALQAAGRQVALSPRLVVYQHRGKLRLGMALAERHIWGRSYAGTRSSLVGLGKRAALAALSPVLPALLLLRMTAAAARKPGTMTAFLKALPLTVALQISWSAGEARGYITGRAHRGGAPAADAILRKGAAAR